MTETKSFWLKDMVVLGQGAPNQISKIGGQQGRCLCLWSDKTGFVRVYPVPHGYVYDWEIINVEVRKPTNDGRENSFVVYNYEQEWKNLSKRLYAQKKIKKLKRAEQIALLESLAKSTFSQIRDNGKSFGLIKPKAMEFMLKQNKETSEAQTTLIDMDYDIMNQNDFAFIPYLHYGCDGSCCSNLSLEYIIVCWFVYEFMRLKPNSEEHCMKLKDNYHIGEEDYLHYILIGNIRKYTTTYVVVKLIRFKIEEEQNAD